MFSAPLLAVAVPDIRTHMFVLLVFWRGFTMLLALFQVQNMNTAVTATFGTMDGATSDTKVVKVREAMNSMLKDTKKACVVNCVINW